MTLMTICSTIAVVVSLLGGAIAYPKLRPYWEEYQGKRKVRRAIATYEEIQSAISEGCDRAIDAVFPRRGESSKSLDELLYILYSCYPEDEWDKEEISEQDAAKLLEISRSAVYSLLLEYSREYPILFNSDDPLKALEQIKEGAVESFFGLQEGAILRYLFATLRDRIPTPPQPKSETQKVEEAIDFLLDFFPEEAEVLESYSATEYPDLHPQERLLCLLQRMASGFPSPSQVYGFRDRDQLGGELIYKSLYQNEDAKNPGVFTPQDFCSRYLDGNPNPRSVSILLDYYELAQEVISSRDEDDVSGVSVGDDLRRMVTLMASRSRQLLTGSDEVAGRLLLSIDPILDKYNQHRIQSLGLNCQPKGIKAIDELVPPSDKEIVRTATRQLYYPVFFLPEFLDETQEGLPLNWQESMVEFKVLVSSALGDRVQGMGRKAIPGVLQMLADSFSPHRNKAMPEEESEVPARENEWEGGREKSRVYISLPMRGEDTPEPDEQSMAYLRRVEDCLRSYDKNFCGNLGVETVNMKFWTLRIPSDQIQGFCNRLLVIESERAHRHYLPVEVEVDGVYTPITQWICRITIQSLKADNELAIASALMKLNESPILRDPSVSFEHLGQTEEDNFEGEYYSEKLPIILPVIRDILTECNITGYSIFISKSCFDETREEMRYLIVVAEDLDTDHASVTVKGTLDELEPVVNAVRWLAFNPPQDSPRKGIVQLPAWEQDETLKTYVWLFEEASPVMPDVALIQDRLDELKRMDVEGCRMDFSKEDPAHTFFSCKYRVRFVCESRKHEVNLYKAIYRLAEQDLLNISSLQVLVTASESRVFADPETNLISWPRYRPLRRALLESDRWMPKLTFDISEDYEHRSASVWISAETLSNTMATALFDVASGCEVADVRLDRFGGDRDVMRFDFILKPVTHPDSEMELRIDRFAIEVRSLINPVDHPNYEVCERPIFWMMLKAGDLKFHPITEWRGGIDVPFDDN